MKKENIKLLRVSMLISSVMLLFQANALAKLPDPADQNQIEQVYQENPNKIGQIFMAVIADVETPENKNSVIDKNRAICESFIQANASKTENCEDAVVACMDGNDLKIRELLNDPTTTPHCTFVSNAPSHWNCPSTSWATIEDKIKNGVTDAHKNLITQLCVAEVLPAAPLSTPTPPPSNTLSDNSADTSTDTSGKRFVTGVPGCSMNLLSLGNVWSGFVSYLPFFMLMLVYGFKRKEK